MLCGTHDYFIQNIKCYYYNASNINYWIISASKKTEKAIERQTYCIERSIFVFYKKSSANRAQEKNKKKV